MTRTFVNAAYDVEIIALKIDPESKQYLLRCDTLDDPLAHIFQITRYPGQHYSTSRIEFTGASARYRAEECGRQLVCAWLAGRESFKEDLHHFLKPLDKR